MPQSPKTKKQPGRRNEPKLFRCTGFGNCDMVFTRSEHLARHARKHTGEKPFKCVVPNCNRMFSRFDNMMQHTHTHARTKKKDSDSTNGKSSPTSVPEDILVPLPTSYAEHQRYMAEHHKSLPGPRLNDKQMYAMYYPPPSPPMTEEEYYKYQQFYNSYHQLNQQHYVYQQPVFVSGQWGPTYYEANTPPPYNQPSSIVQQSVPPTPSSQYQEPSTTFNYSQTASNYSSVTPTADNYGNNVRKNSIRSETTTHHQADKRRLSYVDLSTPIQLLGSDYYHHSISTVKDDDSPNSSDDDDDSRQMSPISMDIDCATNNDDKSRFKSHGIDITADEYEALQGFGKFCAEPVVREPMLMTRITTSPTCSVSFPIQLTPLGTKNKISATAVLSNNSTLPSQVYAFRQQIHTTQESFKRSAN